MIQPFYSSYRYVTEKKKQKTNKQKKNTTSKRFMHSNATTLLIIAKIWKKPYCPSTDKWTKKLWYIWNITQPQ